MGKHIQLNVPEPCHEKWNKMTPVEKGRFCESCQKLVIDFTRMSDEQVIAFFRKPTTGSVCGRFMQDQLDRSMEMTKKRIPWVKYFFQFAVPAFLLSTKAMAQGTPVIRKGDTVVTPVASAIEAVKKIINNEQKKERIIRGRVIDEMKEGISYATIFIKGTTIGVAADSTGTFSLKYSGQEKSIVLVSSCIGFKEVETIVELNKMEERITTALPSNNVLREVIVVASTEIMGGIHFLGAVSVGQRISFIDTVWNKIFPVKKFSNVYPNPVKSNTQLTIQTGKQEKGTYLVQLAAVNGQIILSKELWVEANTPVVKLTIPSVATGVYFLQIINKQTGKRTTEKIMIE